MIEGRDMRGNAVIFVCERCEPEMAQAIKEPW